MNQDIPLSRLTRTPSDYDCPDGELDYVLNLESRGAGIGKAALPAAALIDGSRGRPLFLHRTENYQNLFFLTTDGAARTLTAYSFAADTLASEPLYTYALAADESLRSVDFLGNVVCISWGVRSEYLLFDEGRYVGFETAPPHISLELVARARLRTMPEHKATTGEYVLTSYYTQPLDALPTTDASLLGSEDKKQEQNAAINSRLVKLLSKLSDEHYFCFPVMLRAGLRLKDGSLTMLTEPILCFPFERPAVSCMLRNMRKASDSVTYCKADGYQLRAAAYKLYYKLRVVGDRDKWKAFVQSVDIFMAEPLYSVKQDGEYRYAQAENPTGIGGFMEDAGHTEQETYERTFNGVLTLEETGNFDQVDDTHEFYLVRSIPWADDARLSEDEQQGIHVPQAELDSQLYGFRPLLDDDFSLRTLTTQLRMEDGLRTTYPFLTDRFFVYNRRVHLLGNHVVLCDGTGTNLRRASRFTQIRTMNLSSPVLTFPEMFSYKGVSDPVFLTKDADGRRVAFSNGEGYDNIPSYMACDEPNTYEMWTLQSPLLLKFRFKKHEFLNIAILDRKATVEVVDVGSLPEAERAELLAFIGEAATSRAILSDPNIIKGSDVGAPFTFRPANSLAVGGQRLLAATAMGTAVSTGQYGSYPIILFADDGIYAADPADDGTLRRIAPFSGAVMAHASAWTHTENEIYFVSRKGVHRIHGQEFATLLPFDVCPAIAPASLPLLARCLAAVGVTAPEADLEAFLRRATPVFDRAHDRILFYCAGHPFMAAFYPAAGFWTVLCREAVSHVVAPGRCLLTLADGTTLDMETAATSAAEPFALVTRPLKLGAPAVLKTVSALLARGRFREGAVSLVLYGSRSGSDWHPVASARGSRLQGFSGTGYKYFRAVLLGRLSAGESLSALSVTLRPRDTNRLR